MNAIYVTMVASLLYYNKSVKTSNITGFQPNTKGTCVANFLLNNNHQTICYHVDSCKLSHQDRKINGEYNNTLRDECESVF